MFSKNKSEQDKIDLKWWIDNFGISEEELSKEYFAIKRHILTIQEKHETSLELLKYCFPNLSAKEQVKIWLFHNEVSDWGQPEEKV